MIDPNKQQGRDWLDGKFIVKGFQTADNFIKLNPKQVEYVNAKERSVLFSGGMNAGKTLAFIVKFILLHQWFPGAHSLIGRETQTNAEDTFMKDFMEICPPELYTHQKGAHKIVFNNGSEAEFWGLAALQSGSSTDIKKAMQKLKSHNFHFQFLDQLEEIEQKVYGELQRRLRARMCKHSRENEDGSLNVTIHRNEKGDSIYEVCKECGEYIFNQLGATMNPVLHWSYDWFKVNPRPNTALISTSTLENKAHISESTMQEFMSMPDSTKARFFYGLWDDKSMVEGGVFAEEHIMNQRALVKPPIRVNGGVRIFEEPSPSEYYQIGVDPSTGAVDPCSITCISKTTGKVGATYTAHVPHKVIAEKAVQIALMYSLKARPLIVPEGNDNTVVELLKPLWENIYQRQVYATKDEEKHSSKLGFYTTHATKTQLIENMKALFQAGFPILHDEDYVNELNKFIYTDTAQEKGAGAQKGYHDDRVMSTLLAYWNVPPTGFIDKKSLIAEEQSVQFKRKEGRMYLNSSK